MLHSARTMRKRPTDPGSRWYGLKEESRRNNRKTHAKTPRRKEEQGRLGPDQQPRLENALGRYAPTPLRRHESTVDHHRCGPSFVKAMEDTLVHPSNGLERTTLVHGHNVGRAASDIAASLGVHMDGPRQEGPGRAPNAAIPAARLLHYISRGESHRPTCCYPDLYAGAQGNPRGGHC
jgi:hypothetical protein